MKLSFNSLIHFLALPLVADALCIKNKSDLAFDLVNCNYGHFETGFKNAISDAELAGDSSCLGYRSEILDFFGLYTEYSSCFEDETQPCYKALQLLGITEENYVRRLYAQNLELLKSRIYETCDKILLNDPADSSYNDIAGLFTNDFPHRWIKEFYDGNTYVNQEVQETRPTGKLVDPGSSIRNFYLDQSRSGAVEWPDSYVTNFDQCQLNTVMCCWVTDRVINNNGNGDCSSPYPRADGSDIATSGCIDSDPADNTDVCYVDHERSPQANHVAGGFTIFPGDSEGPAHCHGFVWNEDSIDDSFRFKANNLFYVSLYDHLRNRGYTRNLPGAPMCGCLEQMPTVSRSDCTQTDARYVFTFSLSNGDLNADLSSTTVNFNACNDGNGNTNDLESKINQLYPDNSEYKKYIVGPNNNGEPSNCNGAINEFLTGNNVQTSLA